MPRSQYDRLQRLLDAIDEIPDAKGAAVDQQSAKAARAVIAAALDKYGADARMRPNDIGLVAALARIGSSQPGGVRKTFSGTKKAAAKTSRHLVRKLVQKRANKSKKD